MVQSAGGQCHHGRVNLAPLDGECPGRLGRRRHRSSSWREKAVVHRLRPRVSPRSGRGQRLAPPAAQVIGGIVGTVARVESTVHGRVQSWTSLHTYVTVHPTFCRSEATNALPAFRARRPLPHTPSPSSLCLPLFFRLSYPPGRVPPGPAHQAGPDSAVRLVRRTCHAPPHHAPLRPELHHIPPLQRLGSLQLPCSLPLRRRDLRHRGVQRLPRSPKERLDDTGADLCSPAMALVWLFSSQVALALTPFTVYSIFHVATYTRGVLLPTITPAPAVPAGQKQQASALSESIGSFVKNYYDASMTIVAALEIALWFRILGSALIFQKGSWILLTIYTVFLRARISQSTFVQNTIKQIEARIDAFVTRQDIPPAARQIWAQVKGVAKEAYERTDIARYVGGQQQAPKKAQ
nr:nucleoporin pom33 [Quercus suber]